MKIAPTITPADDVAERELEEREVAGVRRRRHTDERQRARLGRDDREADRPPGRGPVRQEIVARRLLEPREPRAEERDRDEVRRDDEVVGGRQDHYEVPRSAFRFQKPETRTVPTH